MKKTRPLMQQVLELFRTQPQKFDDFPVWLLDKLKLAIAGQLTDQQIAAIFQTFAAHDGNLSALAFRFTPEERLLWIRLAHAQAQDFFDHLEQQLCDMIDGVKPVTYVLEVPPWMMPDESELLETEDEGDLN